MHTTSLKKLSSNTIRQRSGSVFSGIIGGTFSLTLSAVILKLIGLFYKIPLASILGDRGMGYFNSAYTVYAFFYLLCTAGVPKAVMILISRAKAEENGAEESNILRVCSSLFFSIGLIFTALFVVFSGPIAAFVGNNNSFWSMLTIAPSILLVSISGVLRGYLSANMRLIDVAVSQLIEGIGKLVLGLAFAIWGARLKLPLEILSALTILGVTCGCAFGLVYLWICTKIKNSREKIGQSINSKEKRRIRRSVISISMPITLSAAIMSITSIIDLSLIMRSLLKIGYTESEASALYGNYTTLAVPMFNLAISVIAPISIAFLPVFTRCFATGDISSFKRAERSAIDLTAFFVAPIMIGLVVYAREILSMLFPSSNIKVGVVTLSLITPAILFSSMLMIINTSLEAYGRLRTPLLSMGIGSIAKVCVSYYLITRTDMGISGAPIGTVISYAVALFVSIIIYSKCLKTRIPLFERCILPFLAALIAIFISRVIYFRLISMVSPTPLLLGVIGVAALIYLIISLIFGIIGPKKIGEMAKYTKLPT